MKEATPAEKRDLRQLFMQRKPCLVFLAVARAEKPYVSMLMKEADTTFAHTTNLLSEMESFGLVEFVSEGRVKYVKLTKRGKGVFKALELLDSTLGGGSLLKDLKKLEKRVNRLETRIKAGNMDEKAAKRANKSLAEVAALTRAIDAEARLFANQALDYELRVMKERLEYLQTKMLPAQNDG